MAETTGTAQKEREKKKESTNLFRQELRTKIIEKNSQKLKS